jgi:small subunit ribosomal protein S20
MANTKSAKKRARQTVKRTARNTTIRSQVKTAIRAARESIHAESAEAQGKVTKAVSIVAKAAKRGTIHKRNAARRISRLMKRASAQVAAVTK